MCDCASVAGDVCVCVCVFVCVCVCKVIDLVKDSPMEAPVSLHPHQAYSVLARACRLLFLPATSRDALEPCVCQSASACTAIDVFLFEKRKTSVAEE